MRRCLLLSMACERARAVRGWRWLPDPRRVRLRARRPLGDGAQRAGVRRLRPGGSDDCAFAHAGVPPCGQPFSFNPPVSVVPGLDVDAAGRLPVADCGERLDAGLRDGDPSLARLRCDQLVRDGSE